MPPPRPQVPRCKHGLDSRFCGACTAPPPRLSRARKTPPASPARKYGHLPLSASRLAAGIDIKVHTEDISRTEAEPAGWHGTVDLRTTGDSSLRLTASIVWLDPGPPVPPIASRLVWDPRPSSVASPEKTKLDRPRLVGSPDNHAKTPAVDVATGKAGLAVRVLGIIKNGAPLATAFVKRSPQGELEAEYRLILAEKSRDQPDRRLHILIRILCLDSRAHTLNEDPDGPDRRFAQGGLPGLGRRRR